MEIIKDRGIVIKTSDYRDNDKIVTILTENNGILDMLSRGCKKTKSHLLQGSDLFVYGEYIISKSDKLYLNSVNIEDSFYNIRLDEKKLSSGIVMFQICNVLRELDDTNYLHSLLLNSIKALCVCEVNESIMVINKFLYDLLYFLGISPNLTNCCVCGKNIINSKILSFNFNEGSVVCENCIKEYDLKFSKDFIDKVLNISYNKLNHFDNKTDLDIFRFLIKFAEIHLESNFVAKEYLY